MVKRKGYNKVLQPLVYDLKKLEQGVKVYYGAESYTIRAVLVMFVGDTLALHDVFGYLSPSANYFCRICTALRPTFQEDPTKNFPLRTLEWYDTNLEAVQSGQQESAECGLKRQGCVLNTLDNYHVIDNWALDPMHDLGEGLIPLTLQLVLNKYFKTKELGFTVEYINYRISTFNYGYAERKNRPMSNFTTQMLNKPGTYKMRQTAAQNFLLLRSFPFLFSHTVPKDCELMTIIGHLINITRIVLSPVVSENMLLRLNEYIRLYTDLFSDHFDKRINKLHHLQHYEQCIRHIGSTTQSNCLPFEQKNKPLKRQAANCRNFKNITKSLAERQCFSTVIDLLEKPFQDKVQFKPIKKSRQGNVPSTVHINPDVHSFQQKAVHINGVEFRENLIVAFKKHSNRNYPSYGVIKEVHEIDGKPYLLAKCCCTLGYDDTLQAYEVEETDTERFVHIDEIFQHTTFSFWVPHNSETRYVSRRLYNQDY